MEIKLVITADEKALEFARDIARSSSKLGIIGDLEEIKDQVKTAVEAEIKSEEDRPWETIEPDPIKVEVKAEPVETPEVPENPAKKYTAEEVRAAGAEFIKQHGKEAFKEVLAKYGIKKLPELPKEKFAEFMAEVEHA